MTPGTRHRLLVDEVLRMMADRVDGPISRGEDFDVEAANARLRFAIPGASNLEIGSAWREAGGLLEERRIEQAFETAAFVRWLDLMASRPPNVSVIEFTKTKAADGDPIAVGMLSKIMRAGRS